jgi:hypothetical protein
VNLCGYGVSRSPGPGESAYDKERDGVRTSAR